MGQDKTPMMPDEIIEMDLYGTRFCMPYRYISHFLYLNCYPEIIPGRTVYGSLQEQRAQALMIQYLYDRKQKPIFIDIGASVGVFSLLAAQQGADVIAFEAMSNLCVVLKENLKAYPDTQIHCCILSNDSNQDLYIGKWGTNIIEVRDEPDEALLEKVQVNRLDDYSLTPYLIKVDVEGMGIAVLEGATETLKQTSVIMVEIHDGNEYVGVTGLIEKAGFIWQVISEAHVIGVKPPLLLPKDFLIHWPREVSFG